MSIEITTDLEEANVLSNVRQDRRNLHNHPYIDLDRSRRPALRRYIRSAIRRVRAHRARKAANPTYAAYAAKGV